MAHITVCSVFLAAQTATTVVMVISDDDRANLGFQLFLQPGMWMTMLSSDISRICDTQPAIGDIAFAILAYSGYTNPKGPSPQQSYTYPKPVP